MTKADERLTESGRTKLVGLLAAGDPKGEVRMAGHAKKLSVGSTSTPTMPSLSDTSNA